MTLINFLLIIDNYSHLFIQLNTFSHQYRLLCLLFLLCLSVCSQLFNSLFFFYINLSSFLIRLSVSFYFSCPDTNSAFSFHFCPCRKTSDCWFPVMLFSLEFQLSTATRNPNTGAVLTDRRTYVSFERSRRIDFKFS
jgi:hypothetical protein